jgi:hypothetical protein
LEKETRAFGIWCPFGDDDIIDGPHHDAGTSAPTGDLRQAGGVDQER